MANDERNGELTLLWQFVDHWARLKPEAEALVFEDTRMSWGEFADQVDRTALAFLDAGVRRGDRVAMVAMARPEFLITYMAAAKIGAIWLGISPKFSVEEVRYILGHCKPAVIITLDKYMGVDLLEAGAAFAGEFPFVRRVLTIGDSHPELTGFADYIAMDRSVLRPELEARVAESTPDDEVLLMYTSGSTGKPKGVLHSHRSIIENIRVEARHFGFHEESRLLIHFPINHVAADVELGFAAMLSGATTVLMDRFDPEASLAKVSSERITCLGQVPVMFLLQMQTERFRKMDWISLETFVWGGAAAPEPMLEVLRGIAAQTGARLVTGYGSTELCGFVTYTEPGDDAETMARSVGRAPSPFEFRILSDEEVALPAGEVGELVVRGPSTMTRYFGDPEATAEVLDGDGWYHTGDLGWVDDSGRIYLSGRRSDMFKSGGENVFPREIEDLLERHDAVIFAAVIGVPDPLYAEVGHAFVMVKGGAAISTAELDAFCHEKLVNFKVPKQFTLRESLPLLANGKVDKMALRRELGL